MPATELASQEEQEMAVARRLFQGKTLHKSWKVERILAVCKNEGVVMLVKRAGQHKVIKSVVKSPDSAEAIRSETEIGILMKDCPLAVVCEEYWAVGDRVFNLQPCCAQGDLVNVIYAYWDREKQGLPEAMIKAWGCQAALVIDYAHRRGILHRDVKPDNMFVDKNGYIRLGDWDAATQAPQQGDDYDRTRYDQSMCGTIMFVAPEVMAEDCASNYAEPVDYWCLGASLLAMCGTVPRGDMTTQEVVKAGLPLPDIPECYSREFDRVIKKMLTLNPVDRLTARGLLREPCMRTEAIGACRLYHKLAGKPDYQQLLEELLQAEAAAGQAGADKPEVPSSGTSVAASISSSISSPVSSVGSDAEARRKPRGHVVACVKSPGVVATSGRKVDEAKAARPVSNTGANQATVPHTRKPAHVRPCPAPTVKKLAAPQETSPAAVSRATRQPPAVILATKVAVARPGLKPAAAQAANKPAIPASAKARIAERQAAALAKYGAGRQGTSNATRAPAVVSCPVKTEAAPARRQPLQLPVNKVATPAAARLPSSKTKVVPVTKPLNATPTITAAPTKPAAATRAVPMAKPLNATPTITAAPTKPAAATRAVPVAKPLNATPTITAAPTKPAAATRAVPVAKPLNATPTITAAPTKPAAATRTVPVAKPLNATPTITAAPTKPAAATRAVPVTKPLNATPTITGAPSKPAAAKLAAVATTVTAYPIKPTAPKQVNLNPADSALCKPKPATRMAAQAPVVQQRSSKPTWV